MVPDPLEFRCLIEWLCLRIRLIPLQNLLLTVHYLCVLIIWIWLSWLLIFSAHYNLCECMSKFGALLPLDFLSLRLFRYVWLMFLEQVVPYQEAKLKQIFCSI